MKFNELRDKYLMYSSEELESDFLKLCSSGTIEEVKYVSYFIKKSGIFNKGFLNACENGNLNVIEYLLNSKDIKKEFNICFDKNAALGYASTKGIFEVVKYLLTSPDLKEHADIHSCDNLTFKNATNIGNLEIVKYLTTSQDLKERIESKDLLNYALRTACYFGYTDIVKFLLEEPILKNKINLYSIDETGDNAFLLACQENNMDIVEYFIFEKDIDRTSAIQNYIDLNSADNISKLFQVRGLNNILKAELNSEKQTNRKLKV